jgi:hypothetical protein
MRTKTWIAIALALALMFAVSGCDLLQGAQEVVETVKEVASEQAAPVGEATPSSATGKQAATPDDDDVAEQEAEAEEEIDLADVEALDSYRQLVSWETTEGDETNSWSMLTEFVRDPAAQRTVMVVVDDAGTEFGWEMIQIGTTTYMKYSTEGEEDAWMSMTSDDAEPPSQDLDMYNLQGSEYYLNSGHCANKGRDDVEGQRATHYVCTKDVYGDEFSFWIAGGRLTAGGMEFWISAEYDVEVRNISWWDVVDQDNVEYTWRVEQKVWDINQPISIEAPEGVAAAGLPEDVPLYPDATITTAMTGMVAFEVVAELDDVVAFFKEEMPNNGWALESEYAGMLSYTKEARQITIMVGQDEGSAKVSGAYMLTE